MKQELFTSEYRDLRDDIAVSEIENRVELKNHKQRYVSRDEYLHRLAKLLSRIPLCRSKLESQSIWQILEEHFQNGANVPLWLEP